MAGALNLSLLKLCLVVLTVLFCQPDFCGVLALETCDCPSDDIKDFFDPHSPDPQRRALCCLFLDNTEWTDKQRQILRSKSWSKRWKKLECVCSVWHGPKCSLTKRSSRRIEDQDELMLGRRTVRTAGVKRSARLRARDRRSAAPQLHAPLVYPPEDADSVIVTNADLLRCALTNCMAWNASLIRTHRRRLEVSEFLNDSLVDFALKRLQEELARRLSPAQYEVRICASNLRCTPLSRVCAPVAQVPLLQLFFLQKAALRRGFYAVRLQLGRACIMPR